MFNLGPYATKKVHRTYGVGVASKFIIHYTEFLREDVKPGYDTSIKVLIEVNERALRS